ncbi:MAG: hypothetical protein JSV95_10115 [Gemmatimonadota bacterium]|jgi:hypothetical protein|nr:MAG: hypothetical protein JSV95_10115 [Gemmatimonadota bacterium]
MKANVETGRKRSSPARVLALTGTLAAACWRIGEPTADEAIVSWAAYPDTVVVRESFSLEFAGPVSPTTCGRLDTAVVTLTDEEVVLSAERSVFDARCPGERVSFYHARPFAIERAGSYRLRTRRGLDLGTITAIDSGRFSPMVAVGEGTVRSVGGCWLFGPGWASNQRPFALRDAPPEITAEAGTDRVVFIRGAFAGFTLCGSWGSRPSIRVEIARVTERYGRDYYD